MNLILPFDSCSIGNLPSDRLKGLVSLNLPKLTEADLIFSTQRIQSPCRASSPTYTHPIEPNFQV